MRCSEAGLPVRGHTMNDTELDTILTDPTARTLYYKEMVEGYYNRDRYLSPGLGRFLSFCHFYGFGNLAGSYACHRTLGSGRWGIPARYAGARRRVWHRWSGIEYR